MVVNQILSIYVWADAKNIFNEDGLLKLYI